MSALHYVAIILSYRHCNTFAKYGINSNIRCYEGKTALHYSAIKKILILQKSY
ncbi:MAG: hypothetical protein AB8U25_04325 [Rickettsiales endosymbiont of Dermacentor nuttalli]